MAAELQRIGIDSVEHVQAHRLGARRTMKPLFASYGVPTNSEFDPFVDMNAPRARFLGQYALALTELNMLPAPITQLLGGGPIPVRAPDPHALVNHLKASRGAHWHCARSREHRWPL